MQRIDQGRQRGVLRVFPRSEGVALRRTTAGVAAFAKANSLGGKPQLAGSPPRNAMPTTGV